MLGRPRSYRNEILNTPGVVALYRFGQPSGTVAVDETGRYDGTYAGSPTLGDRGLTSAGGTSMSTTSVSGQYVTVPNGVRDVMNSTAWTFMLTVVMRSNTTHGLIIGPKGGASARCFGSRFNGLAAGTSSTLMGWAEENVAVISGGFIDVSLNVRHHIACTYGGGQLTGYQDGNLNLAGPISYTWTANFTGTMTISSSTSGADGSEDAIYDDFAFFDRRLSQFEIARLDRIGRGF